MIYRHWDFDSVTFSNHKMSETGSGLVEVTTEGKATIRINLNHPVRLAHGYLDVIGKSASGLTMSARGMMTNVTFGTSAAVQIRPLDIFIFEKGISEVCPFDETSWHLKNAKVLLGPHTETIDGYSVTLESLIGATASHSQLEGEISTLLKSKVTNATSIVLSEFQDNLCRLLSLAQRCPTPPVIKEFFVAGKLAFTQISEQTWDYIALRPLVDCYARDILLFLKAVHPAFNQQKTSYGLVTLLEYYWRSHVENTAEVKFLFASIFMETLKFNWAANVSTFLDKDIKANGLVRGFRPKGAPKNAKNLNFETLLDETAAHLGYPKKVFTFIDDRNCIFHSGLSSAAQTSNPSSWLIIRPELQKLYNQIDDLLLRILNFTGVIFEVDLSVGQKKVAFPSRSPLP